MYDPGADGGGSDSTRSDSAFSFDLGSALDRFGSDDESSEPAPPPPLSPPAAEEAPSALEAALSALPLPGTTAPTPSPPPPVAPDPVAETSSAPDLPPMPVRETPSPVVAAAEPAPAPTPMPVRETVTPTPVVTTPEPAPAPAPTPVADTAPAGSALPTRTAAAPTEPSAPQQAVATPDSVADVSALPVRGGAQTATATQPADAPDTGGLPVRQPRTTPPAATATPATPATPADGAGGLPVRRPAAQTAAPSPQPEPAPAAAPAAVPDEEELQRRPWLAESVDSPGGQIAPPNRSVFDDLGSSTQSPMLSPTAVAPAAPAASAPAYNPGGIEFGSGGPGGQSPQIPVVPAGATPVLPEVVPSASAVPAGESLAKNVGITDVKAMRSAQLKASRQQRQGKVFGRSVIAFFFIAALIAGALFFGRPYLFATEWDVRLVPTVDAVQTSRGIEFDEAVPAIEQPSAQYGRTVSTILLGADWADRLPEWRALGLATGATTAETVATRMATVRAAIFDPATATIYLNADADFEASEADLLLAVEQAYAHQMSSEPDPLVPDDASLDASLDGSSAAGVPGFAGLLPVDRLISEAVDRAVTESQRDLAGDEAGVDTQPFPVPVAYQIAAMNQLGEALLGAASIDPATRLVGEPIPAVVSERLDDRSVEMPTGALAPSDVSLIGPVALGIDDWSLVWGARLPVSSVDQLAAAITGDSYRVVEREGRICSVAIFQTASPESAAATLETLLVWGSTAPNETNTTVVALDATRIQIDACDPNMIAGTPSLNSVTQVIDRQIQRLS